MVRAILAGEKTQTRRLVKHIPMLGDPAGWCPNAVSHNATWHRMIGDYRQFCPYGQPGDRLWVRETHVVCVDGEVHYRADGRIQDVEIRWSPSIFMRRTHSRITLEITDVRVERLQDMEGQHATESDALKEGVHAIHHGDGAYSYSAFRTDPHGDNWIDPCDAFRELWESINGIGSWALNPWVWALTFKRIPA